jgi:D-alanine-D-alanine ligase
VDIGIAYDLRSDFRVAEGDPEDRLEEYDSEATVEAIAAALAANGHRPRPMGGGRRFLEEALRRPPDLVFNIAEGRGARSREAQVPAACEMLGIRCTHSDPLTLALTLDKAMAKKVVVADGVPTPRFALVEAPDDPALARLAFPVIAKPNAEGSSMGIRRGSRVEAPADLRTLVAGLLRDYREPVLVEEFCPGAEFTVGILGTGPSASILGVMEVAPRRGRPEEFVYSLEVKRNYLEEVEYFVPPRSAPALIARVRATALAAHRSLGCRDVARVDLRVGSDGEPKFLEVNPLPGLDPRSGDLPILAGRVGMPYEALIGRIVESALARGSA